jgi:hypothetical protein
MWDKVETTQMTLGVKTEKSPFPFFDHLIGEEEYGEEENEDYY